MSYYHESKAERAQAQREYDQIADPHRAKIERLSAELAQVRGALAARTAERDALRLKLDDAMDRAELTSDAEVLRRAEQILRGAGIDEVLLLEDFAEVFPTHGSNPHVAGATLAEAVAALKETP